MDENMQAGAGARPDVPFFLVLLTDGKSQDDAVSAASRLKNIGVEIIAVGEDEDSVRVQFSCLGRFDKSRYG